MKSVDDIIKLFEECCKDNGATYGYYPVAKEIPILDTPKDVNDGYLYKVITPICL